MPVDDQVVLTLRDNVGWTEPFETWLTPDTPRPIVGWEITVGCLLEPKAGQDAEDEYFFGTDDGTVVITDPSQGAYQLAVPSTVLRTKAKGRVRIQIRGRETPSHDWVELWSGWRNLQAGIGA